MSIGKIIGGCCCVAIGVRLIGGEMVNHYICDLAKYGEEQGEVHLTYDKGFGTGRQKGYLDLYSKRPS